MVPPNCPMSEPAVTWAEHAVLEQALVALGLAQEARAALGVGEQDRPALERTARDQGLEVPAPASGRLEQHVATAAEGQPSSSCSSRSMTGQRDLAAGAQLDVDAPRSSTAPTSATRPGSEAGSTSHQWSMCGVVTSVDVPPSRGACEGDRPLDVCRPVVDARKGVTVQVDHGLV
jgi:hypothetical protein